MQAVILLLALLANLVFCKQKDCLRSSSHRSLNSKTAKLVYEVRSREEQLSEKDSK